jgi:uncharacterized phiE125 gp8 family phage protein
MQWNHDTTHFSLKRIAEPAVEPVSLADLRQWLRVDPDFTDDDYQIVTLGVAARQLIEEELRTSLITQTWQVAWDRFPWGNNLLWGTGAWHLESVILGGQTVLCLRLPRPPVQSVVSLTYSDGSTGAVTTLDPSMYRVDTDSWPARVQPVWGTLWPFTRPQTETVVCQYTAGYGNSAEAIPKSIIMAIMYLVATWYSQRESVVIGVTTAVVKNTLDRLLGPYRVGDYP